MRMAILVGQLRIFDERESDDDDDDEDDESIRSKS